MREHGSAPGSGSDVVGMRGMLVGYAPQQAIGALHQADVHDDQHEVHEDRPCAPK
jgi:hypothetical protein